ncbi:ATP-dependent DNA helicase UvrD2 [Demequina sp. TTPB684]|uniref:ATP-dependent helicase n=1 Tax=unclassified Demequina TaxID=2620311 RepID=UPI001CF2AE4F|nr:MULTISPECIES: ATP-dependent DNA helicase UvrD2 [unclassified Demequina]MCB2412068.1 ATP-dependent DNA helicase UvrD2 [Demequina sp. TTPB684]UPU88522.1 ATP-dependent DNA helicase UvrD2 [Demequina sp. TMPB413]
MSADQILEALDPEQREVATALHGPVCVLAGAGTGKTRAITHRMAYGVRVGAFNPQSVLAVTFTARAAGEMRQRLRSLGADGIQARTFHAAALRQLSYFWPQVVGGQLPQLVDQKAPLVGRAARAAGLSPDRLTVRDLASEIEWAKVSLVAAEDYAAVIKAKRRPAPAGIDAMQVADVMRSYEEAKTDAVVLDFEDILLLLADIIGRHAEVGDQIRRQYRHFVVDEYQDVSPLQQYVLDQWLGGRRELCVVGDPAQTIYSFAGASPEHLLGFTGRYEDAAVVRLVRDYRSTPQVVNLANGLMAHRGNSTAGLELVSQRPSGPGVGFHAYADDVAEAAAVADRIEALVSSGVAAREIAVLYRTNSQSEEIEDALAHRGIGYLVRGGQRFFAREEVRKALVLLRGAAVAASDDPLGAQVREAITDAGWSEQPPAARGAVRERWDALQALVELADNFDVDAVAGTGEPATLRDFVEHLADRASAQHAPSVDGVTLTTIHAAKGLEWDAVFLVGMSEGLLPISMAETDEAIEEERRLLYVGITRAREHLHVSFARSRKEGGRATRKRTRFLEKWWPDAGASAQRRVPRAAAHDLDADEAKLFEALKAWRLELAQATSKPAFTVLVDSSLVAIARNRPQTLGELAKVHGVGASKLERYGADILRLVAAH